MSPSLENNKKRFQIWSNKKSIGSYWTDSFLEALKLHQKSALKITLKLDKFGPGRHSINGIEVFEHEYDSINNKI